jgi:RNA polymerase sigma factor (sigma-70 family)
MIFVAAAVITDMSSTTRDPKTDLDRASFTASVQRYRRELHVHCYRMLGSFEESEDLVQETFLRAWRRRQTFEGRSSLRAWLYRIATNACLDALDKRPRTVSANGEVLWLQPYPDELLEELVGAGDDPEATVVSKETIELAYLVAIQRVPTTEGGSARWAELSSKGAASAERGRSSLRAETMAVIGATGRPGVTRLVTLRPVRAAAHS